MGWMRAGYPGGSRCVSACSRLPLKLANLSQKAIKADTDIGFQRFKPAAFSKTATCDLSDPDLDPVVRAELEYTLRKVRKIFRKALYCQTRGHAENAWCDDVVRPMVRL